MQLDSQAGTGSSDAALMHCNWFYGFFVMYVTDGGDRVSYF